MLHKYPPTDDLDSVEQIAQDHAHDHNGDDARAIVVELFTGDEPTDETPGALWLMTGSDAHAWDEDALAYIEAHAAPGKAFDTTLTQTHVDAP